MSVASARPLRAQGAGVRGPTPPMCYIGISTCHTSVCTYFTLISHLHMHTGRHIHNSIIHSCIYGCIHRFRKYSPPAPSLLLSSDTQSTGQPEETWEPGRPAVSPGPLSLRHVGNLEMGIWLHLVMSESIAPVEPQASG